MTNIYDGKNIYSLIRFLCNTQVKVNVSEYAILARFIALALILIYCSGLMLLFCNEICLRLGYY